MMPKCANHNSCGQEGFIYINGRYYCGECYKKFDEKMKIATDKMLMEE